MNENARNKTAHELACSASRELCQQLFEALNQRIPNLKYKKGANKCSISVEGARRVPVWINSHSLRARTLNVWFLGDPKPEMQLDELKIHPRSKTEGSWAEYGGSFMIKNDKQFEEAVKFLVDVSFPAALD
jgi:hypothetical protein